MTQETCRILVVSDTPWAGDAAALAAAPRTGRRAVFLGDGLYDLETGHHAGAPAAPYPIYRVRGNCDVGYQDPPEGLAPFAGYCFFIPTATCTAPRPAGPPGRSRDQPRRGCGAVRPQPTASACSRGWRACPRCQSGQPAGHRQLRRDRGGGRPLQLWLEARAAGMSGLNTLIRLPAADSTNAWAKANLDRFRPGGRGVHDKTRQPGAGGWAAPGQRRRQALYYTAVLRLPLADPGALPLYASLAVAAALRRQYGADCQIKWPNDLLLHGKKIVGILCESCQSPEPGGPAGDFCAALASTWPNRRNTLRKTPCPTRPAWRWRGPPYTRKPTPARWPRR